MKKLTNKKAFTLVEIIVVIVIVGVLASVIITGYTSYIAKANKVNDISIVKQMNDHLEIQKAVDGKNNTYTDMKNDLQEIGIVIDILQPRSKDYTFAWDYDKDLVVMLDKNNNIVEPREQNGVSIEDKKYNYYISVSKASEIRDGFSLYLKDDFTGTLQTLKAGIDTGNKSGLSLNITNPTDSIKVSVRTTGGSTLTVDAPNGEIKHYGELNTLDITAVAQKSYHEFGEVKGNVTVAQGKFVAEAGAKVSVIQPTLESAEIIINNGSEVGSLAGDESIINNIEVPSTVQKYPVNGEKIAEMAKFGGGLGTEASPYIIANETQWLNFTKGEAGDITKYSLANKHWSVVSDLDFSAYLGNKLTNPANNKQYESYHPLIFRGYIDFNNHSVLGLQTDQGTDYNEKFFFLFVKGGEIKNLNLYNRALAFYLSHDGSTSYANEEIVLENINTRGTLHVNDNNTSAFAVAIYRGKQS